MNRADDEFEVQKAEEWRTARREACNGFPEVLARLLRSGSPDPDTLRWLADLFDPDSTSEYQVKKIERRKAGKPPKPRSAVVIAACHVIANVTAETKMDALLAEAISISASSGKPVALSTLKDYIKRHWPEFGARLKAAKRSG